jgi:hypothetical protein
MSEGYFASASSADISGKLEERIDAYYEWCQQSGLTSLLRKSHALSNGLTVNGTGGMSYALTRGGDQGEMVMSVENHFRSIGNGLLTITTAQRPAIQCSAANSDYRSLAQTLLANGIIEFHMAERRLESLLKRATKSAIFLLEGFVLVEWDATSGEVYTSNEAEDGTVTPVRSGDPRITCLGLLDVIRDPYATGFETLDWVIAREYVNKHDLAERYPEKRDAIEGLHDEEETERKLTLGPAQRRQESDLVPLYKFFHRPSNAVPDGRMVEFLRNDITLYDGPNPYQELPVYRVVCDDIEGTPFGTSPMLDLMGPQDAVNALDSSIHTNMLGRGIGNMLVPEEANISVEELSSSMNAIKYRAGFEPKALQWPNTPGEFFELKAEKIAAMETLSGVSSVVRGNPSENIGADASGAKLALLQAQSVQSNSGLQNSYANLVRDVALALIKRYRDFGGEVPRLARLAGKANQYLAKEFTSADLSDIDRVTVDVGSPLMRTVSGKMSIADKLVEMGVVKTAEQYLMLVKAGTYEPLVEGEQQQQMRIRGENERLMEGGFHRALISDPHWLEVPQHLAVLDNPSLREPGPENDAVQAAVLAAVSEHLQLFRSMPPDLVMMRGGPQAFEMWQAIQMAQSGSMSAPGAPGETSSTPPPESGATDVANPEASTPEQPGLPSPSQPPAGAIPFGAQELAQ